MDIMRDIEPEQEQVIGRMRAREFWTAIDTRIPEPHRPISMPRWRRG